MKFKKTEKCDKVNEAYTVITTNMLNTISEDNRFKIMAMTRSRLGCKGENEYGECNPDFIVFERNDTPFEKEEDEGRSLKIGMPGLEDKVYVKLDDYGSKEALADSVGHPVNTQLVATYMLSSDY